MGTPGNQNSTQREASYSAMMISDVSGRDKGRAEVEESSLQGYHQGVELHGIEEFKGMKEGNVKDTRVCGAKADRVVDWDASQDEDNAEEGMSSYLNICNTGYMGLEDNGVKVPACSLKGFNEIETHIHLLRSMVDECSRWNEDSIKEGLLRDVYSDFKNTIMIDIEVERRGGDSCGYVDGDGALFLNELKDDLSCLKEVSARFFNIYAEFRFCDEGPLAGWFSKGSYFEDEFSIWWQHSSTSKVIWKVWSAWCYLIFYDENDILFTSDIMQTFVFDPGGLDHMELVQSLGWSCSLLAKWIDYSWSKLSRIVLLKLR